MKVLVTGKWENAGAGNGIGVASAVTLADTPANADISPGMDTPVTLNESMSSCP